MRAYLTPDAGDGSTVARVLVVPIEYLPAFNGALGELARSYNWETYGDIDADQAAQDCEDILNAYYANGDGLTIPETTIPATPSSGFLKVWADALHNLRRRSSLGQNDILLNGQLAGWTYIANSGTEKPMLIRTIKANAIGLRGMVKAHAFGRVFNNHSAGDTITIRLRIGGSSLVLVNALALGLSASASTAFNVEVTIVGDNSESAPTIYGRVAYWLNQAPSTLSAPTYDQGFWTSLACDTTADWDLQITGQLSVSNAALLWLSNGLTVGPFRNQSQTINP